MLNKILILIAISIIPQSILLIYCIKIFLKRRRLKTNNIRVYEFDRPMSKPINAHTNLSGDSYHPSDSDDSENKSLDATDF